MAVADHYLTANTTISRRVQAQLAALWRSIDWRNLDAWFAVNRHQVIAAVRRGQLDAAVLALPYMQQAALEAGVVLPESPAVAPKAFVDGSYTDAQLGKILQGSVILAKYRAGQGWEQPDALRSGGQRLLGLADVLVRDAGREALTANMVMNDSCVGYRRQASGTSCGRCLILIGKFFKTNEGFPRHPQCDCVHVPVYRDANGKDVFAGDKRTGEDLFDSMSPAEQKAALGADADLVTSGRKSLQDVVNARLRSPDKLDRLHMKASTPKGLRLRYGNDPTKFREAMQQHGYLA